MAYRLTEPSPIFSSHLFKWVINLLGLYVISDVKHNNGGNLGYSQVPYHLYLESGLSTWTSQKSKKNKNKLDRECRKELNHNII